MMNLISRSVIVPSTGTIHFTPVAFLQYLHALNLHQSRNFNQNYLFMYASPRKGFRLHFSEKGVFLLNKMFTQTVLSILFFRLLKKHYSDGNYKFWPDLASSHYAKTLVDYTLERKKLKNLLGKMRARLMSRKIYLLKTQVYFKW